MAVEGYNPDDYPRVAVAVDMVVLTIRSGALSVLLIERSGEPFKGTWALPGGFIRPDETLDQAAARELKEETGVDAADHLEQLATYGAPDRDPRMRVVSVAFLAILRSIGPIAAATDAAAVDVVPVKDVVGHDAPLSLAFDHRRILEDGVERARAKLEYTSLATAFVGPEFTLSQLREVYEATWGERVDPGNFRRKILSTDGLVVPTGRRVRPGPDGGKPAEIYAAGPAEQLDPPLRRPTKPGPRRSD